MIRVRRYEIIKLGLDGGEGDGGARRGDEERTGGKAERRRWMSGRRWDAGWRGGRIRGREGGKERSRRITVFRILVYERQPRRPFETRAATAAVVAAEES